MASTSSGEKTQRQYTFTVVDHPLLPVPNRVRISTSHFEPSRIARGVIRRDEQISCVVHELQASRDEPWIHRFTSTLVVVSEDCSMDRLLDLSPRLREFGCRCLVGPDRPDVVSVVMLIASQGVPVRLDVSGDWSEDALDALREYFLFSPALSVPIEPFYTVSSALGDPQGRYSLWETYGEVPGSDFFIAADGRLSLSEAWIEAGQCFGHVDQDRDVFMASDTWRRMEDMWIETFNKRTECSYCQCYLYCRGYLVFGRMKRVGCAVWKRQFQQLSSVLTKAGMHHAKPRTDKLL